MDLVNLVKEVKALTEQAMRGEIIRDTPERKGVYFVRNNEGVLEEHTSGPRWHTEVMDSPVQLAAFMREYDLLSKRGASFYSGGGITTVYDIADRRDIVTCPLKWSQQYTFLDGRAKPGAGAMSQGDLVRILRILFRNCLPQDSVLLSLIRQLKFSAIGENSVAIAHGNESMGRSINNKVSGESAIPDELALLVPIFENHPFRFQIVCALEIFPADSAFKLTPYPGEVQKAMDAALESVRETITGDGLPPAFMGTP